METYRVLIKPLVTEKSNLGPQDRKYTFKVAINATKEDIKRAITEQFGVKVVSVNTAKFSGKSKSRNFRSKGKRANWKKAYVTLAPGETIAELYEDLG